MNEPVFGQAAADRINEDRRAWDTFAAAALSLIVRERPADAQAVEHAAALADLMMEQRRRRHATAVQART